MEEVMRGFVYGIVNVSQPYISISSADAVQRTNLNCIRLCVEAISVIAVIAILSQLTTGLSSSCSPNSSSLFTAASELLVSDGSFPVPWPSLHPCYPCSGALDIVWRAVLIHFVLRPGFARLLEDPFWLCTALATLSHSHRTSTQDDCHCTMPKPSQSKPVS